MRKKCVAVLDIRSSSVTGVVGERGVNDTFIIKSKYSCPYEGYMDGEFIDEKSFLAAVDDVVRSTVTAMDGLKSFYIGVPGEFLKVINTDKIISFQSSKKITGADCEYLAELSKPAETADYSIIRHSCEYFVLSDKRKTVNPVGIVSDSLQGKFCFYLCKKNIGNILIKAFKPFGFLNGLKLIPSIHAQAMYLISPEIRDEYAVLFDLGYISSTYSVVLGNGLAFSESFSVGVGHIAVHLSDELDIPFPVASEFLTKVNLNAKETLNSFEEVTYKGKTYKYTTVTLRDKIRDALDGICETIETCRQSFTGKNLEFKPVYITGESIKTIRGTAEHISNRLVKNVEIISPKVPYYDKPQFSSLLSLLDTALEDERAVSFFHK